MTSPVSRRQFVVAATLLSSLVLSPAAFRARLAQAQSGEDSDAAMIRLARLLAPHEDISDQEYADVLDIALNALGESLTNALADAEAALDTAAGGDFLTANVDTQLSAITSIEDAAYFQDVLHAVKLVLYGHPAAWRVMGYEGPSWQLGGYAGRGAGEIDWLPGED